MAEHGHHGDAHQSHDHDHSDSNNGHHGMNMDVAPEDRLEMWRQMGDESEEFEITEVDKLLLDHLHSLFRGKKDVRVLVPLCGSSVDVKWFYDQGYSVVGIEGVEKFAKKIFDSVNSEYSKINLDNGNLLYKLPDDRLQIFVGDIFTMDEKLLGKFDFVLDKESFVALYKSDRAAYVELMKKLLAPDYMYLITYMEFDEGKTCSGTSAELVKSIHDFFGDFNSIRELGRFDMLDGKDEEMKKVWGTEQMWEIGLLMSHKK